MLARLKRSSVVPRLLYSRSDLSLAVALSALCSLSVAGSESGGAGGPQQASLFYPLGAIVATPATFTSSSSSSSSSLHCSGPESLEQCVSGGHKGLAVAAQHRRALWRVSEPLLSRVPTHHTMAPYFQPAGYLLSGASDPTRYY